MYTRRGVGDGRTIKPRTDPWLPRGILGGPAQRDEPPLLADYMDFSHNTWNAPLLRRFFDDSIVAKILTIPVRPNYISDQLIWSASTDGKYSVKKGYQSIKQSQTALSGVTLNIATDSTQAREMLWKHIWKLQIPPKI